MESNWVKGKCIKCKLARTPEGHDPCLGELPGVLFACCGHGVDEGYIYFQNGVQVRFFAVEIEQVSPDELARGRALKQSELFEAYRLRRLKGNAVNRRPDGVAQTQAARAVRWANKSSEG